MAPRTAYRQPQAGGQGFARTKKVFGGPVVTLIAADVVLNAQTAVMRLPKGFVMQSITGTIGDCDTGATLMLALGDAGSQARFWAAHAIGQAGSSTLPTLLNLPYEFTDDTDLLLTATVAAVALGPTPTVLLLAEGYMK